MSGSRRCLALIAALFAAAIPQLAEAHPLGNFTINHYSRIEPAGNAVEIRYVLDMAEIPTFQEKSQADADPNAYADAKANALAFNLHLTLDGQPALLRVVNRTLSFPEGQAGLPTTRLEVLYAADLSNGQNSPIALTYRDDNDAERIGWREIVARPATEQTHILQSTVPEQDQSDELRNYPADLLASPLAVREAHLEFVGGGTAPIVDTANAALSAITRTQTAFAEVANADLSPQAVALALLIAMFFGAQHALQPGHGKTIVAAYLVGSRGTPKHALFLGGTVTATHTAGVYVLGLVTLFLSAYIVPEKLYPVIGVVSGLTVVGMGGWLLYKRARVLLSKPHAHDHDHDHDHHHHHHVHEGSQHAHSHLPPGAEGERVTWRSLLALGVTGGALPCPEALVVLLATLALGRAAFGLLLVFAFSLGLAGVLVGFGLLMVYARNWFGRLNMGTGLAPRLLGLISAAVIVGAGSVITLQALSVTL